MQQSAKTTVQILILVIFFYGCSNSTRTRDFIEKTEFGVNDVGYLDTISVDTVSSINPIDLEEYRDLMYTCRRKGKWYFYYHDSLVAMIDYNYDSVMKDKLNPCFFSATHNTLKNIGHKTGW